LSSTITRRTSAPKGPTRCAHIGRIFENNPDMRFSTRSFHAGEDFAVCEWTLNLTKDGRSLEWDGVDVFPLRDGLIARKDVYSTSHRPRER